MAKLDDYRKYIKDIITRYSQYKPSYGDVEVQIVFDEPRDHFHNELLAQGVPKADIVLAFQSPFRRQFTDFAVK